MVADIAIDTQRVIEGLDEAFIGQSRSNVRLGVDYPREDCMEWQPIETAPKDEAVIDIYTPEHGIGRCVYMRRVDLGKGNIFYEQTQGGYSCIRTATHWMPLPEAPNVQIEGQAASGLSRSNAGLDTCATEKHHGME